MSDTATPVPDHTPTLEELNAHRGALPERMGIEVLEATPERVVARMPVEGMTNFIVRFRGLSTFSRRRARR